MPAAGAKRGLPHLMLPQQVLPCQLTLVALPALETKHPHFLQTHLIP